MFSTPIDDSEDCDVVSARGEQRIHEIAGDHGDQSDEERAHDPEAENEETAEQGARDRHPHADKSRHGADFHEGEGLAIHRSGHRSHDEVGKTIEPDHRQNQQSRPAMMTEEVDEGCDHRAVEPSDGMADLAPHIEFLFDRLRFAARILLRRSAGGQTSPPCPGRSGSRERSIRRATTPVAPGRAPAPRSPVPSTDIRADRRRASCPVPRQAQFRCARHRPKCPDSRRRSQAAAQTGQLERGRCADQTTRAQ